MGGMPSIPMRFIPHRGGGICGGITPKAMGGGAPIGSIAALPNRFLAVRRTTFVSGSGRISAKECASGQFASSAQRPLRNALQGKHLKYISLAGGLLLCPRVASPSAAAAPRRDAFAGEGRDKLPRIRHGRAYRSEVGHH